MAGQVSNPGSIGLERSCKNSRSEYIWQKELAKGVELLDVWFQGYAYHRHRHDTYAICLTTAGVQSFGYRGCSRISTPGNIVVLHPDEMHDGQPGTREGLGYRMLYINPGLIFDAARATFGPDTSLPFVSDPVLTHGKLPATVEKAFHYTDEPLGIDSLISELAQGLIASASASIPAPPSRRLDLNALERVRQYLDMEKTRVVRSWELEEITGLSRYELARQFRLRYGTSPYRYMLMRRLEFARKQLAKPLPLADVALASGFSDQSHFTRVFKAGFGLTPAHYRALSGQ
ncbi:MAG: AraC family transcriptional regulator [Desulfobacter sp.]